MSIDPFLALASFGIGIVVGLTGMGGGALMTPVLVLFFKVAPLAAVSSDLVAAMDPALVAASEIAADGASFHFLVKHEKEPAT